MLSISHSKTKDAIPSNRIDYTTKKKHDTCLKSSKAAIVIGIIVAVVGLSIMGGGLMRISQLQHQYRWFEGWTYKTGGSVSSSPALGDVNDDGELEVVIGSRDDTLYVLNLKTGKLVWNYSTYRIISDSPVLGDIDGDNGLEIVINHYETLSALEGNNGTVLWDYFHGSIIYSSPTIGDIDNDSELEVVFGTDNGYIYALEGNNGTQLWNYSVSEVLATSPAIGDINGDNKLDVVIAGYENSEGTIYALDGNNGTQLWNYSVNGRIYASPTIGDINGDNDLEVVIGSYDYNVYALEGNNGTQLWNYSTNAAIGDSASLGDINADGELDVLVANYDDNLYALEGVTGTQIWNYTSGSDFYSSVTLGDFDGNGNLDVVFGAHNGRVYILRGENRKHVWDYSTGDEIRSSPVLTDVNVDGILDIIIGSYDSRVYMLKGELGPRSWLFVDARLGLWLLSLGGLLGITALAVFAIRRKFLQEKFPTTVDWNRQESILHNIKEIRNSQGKKGVEYNIKTKNLTKIYGNRLKKNKVLAVDGIDLLVKDGVHGFLGPNGAGKTTTMKMLTGAISITKGTAKIKGFKAGSIKAQQLIGYMPQNVTYYEKMTGEQYLLHFARLVEVPKEDALTAAKYLLAKFDLEGAADRKLNTYSSGMIQKIGLAASFIGHPEILILDEPTSDLDPVGRDKIISYIKELSHDTSIFVSSHILSEIEQMCDTVTIINNGKIILTDTIENLKTLYGDGNYRFIIDTDSNKEVVYMLEGKQFIKEVNLDSKSNSIHAITDDDTAMEKFVNRLNSEYNISLKKFSQRELSLQDVFLQLINREVSDDL